MSKGNGVRQGGGPDLIEYALLIFLIVLVGVTAVYFYWPKIQQLLHILPNLLGPG